MGNFEFDDLGDTIQAAIGDIHRVIKEDLGDVLPGMLAEDGPESETVEQDFTVNPGAQLTLTTIAGSVQVRGGAEGVIRIRASKHGSTRAVNITRVEMHQEGNHVLVRTRGEHGGAWITKKPAIVEYEIVVPPGTAVNVRSVSADVLLDGTMGPVQAEAVSGDIRLRGVRDVCQLKTVSGDVTAEDVTGSLTLQTTSGDARIGGSIQQFHVNTVSGDVTLTGAGGRQGHNFVKSVSGDLRLFVPDGTGLTVTMKTVSGSVSCDVPAQVINQGRRNWQGIINGGGATLDMNTVSGDLHIEPALAAAGQSNSDVFQPEQSTEAGSENENWSNASSAPTPPREPDDSISNDIPLQPQAAAPSASTASTRTTEILKLLERGEISVEEAMRRLDGEQ